MTELFPRIEDETFIYRAVSYEDFIAPTGKVAPQAFIREFKKRSKSYEEHLSAALTVEDSYSTLGWSYGVIQIKTKYLRDLGLNAVQDKSDHVNLVNFPHPLDNNEVARSLARKVAKKAMVYARWSKEESLKIKTGELNWRDFIVEA